MKVFDDNSKYIYGKNPVREKLKLIKNGVLFIKKGIQHSTIIDIIKKAKSKNIEICFVDNESFKNFFREKNHQGIALKIEEEYTNYITEDDFLSDIDKTHEKKCTIVILDGIDDVGNFGAVLRSCLLFGVDAVILPKNNSAPITDVVVKRSAGAVSQLKIIYATNIVRIIEALKKKGYWIYGADKGGKKLNTIPFNNKCVIVLGREDKGIRALVKKNCDIIATIPTNDKLDSLNLSVSAGIILYEVSKTM
ncbi:MAG: 23S rRNA (guanosine(2251)-2'-O)-methyltransferase RlmB [Spirochaetes bacterium]|nr:23S rRNA (guanosine(2251)-2'-O)-methyltransferase RlmB [Spirochaetota bacterium]